MGFMRDVRKRQEKTDAMFEPLTATVALLKTYGISVSEEILRQLEEAPLAWSGMKKKVLNVREKLSLMQQLEARKIREASDAFGAKVEKFRETFLAIAPTTVRGAKITTDDVAPAYEILDHFHHGVEDKTFVYGSLSTIAAQAKALNEKQELFELHVSEYIQLKRSAEDLEFLKMLWDTASSVIYTFDSWNITLWDKIDVEFLVDECKKLAKEIKMLHKGCRAYDLYKILEDQVKALLTSLPLVSELHHPSMRDRHWKQLMKATGKHFVMDDTFNLGDLLALELHTCVDAVSEIVERAQKELVIEKQLAKFDETWSALNLDFAPFPDSEVLNLVVDDLIAEALENDNLALQNLGGSKYVQGNPVFLERVTEWQTKLGTGGFRAWGLARRRQEVVHARIRLRGLGGYPRAAAGGFQKIRRHKRRFPEPDEGRARCLELRRGVQHGRPLGAPRDHARFARAVREGVAGLPRDEAHRVSALLFRGGGGSAGHLVQGHQPAAHPAPPVEVLRQRAQPVLLYGREGQPEQDRHLDVVRGEGERRV
jgi:hypothetical protein